MRRAAALVGVVLVTGGCALLSKAPVEPETGRRQAAPEPSPAAAPAPPDQTAEQLRRLADEIVELQNIAARLVVTARQHEDQLRTLERRVGEISQSAPQSGAPRGFAPSQASPSPPPGASSAVETAENLHEQGMRQLRAGEADAAMITFYDLIANFPAHPLREIAQFRVAEIYFGQDDVKGALAEWESLLRALPNGRRTADTLLKIGQCYRTLGDEARARQFWERVVRQYPSAGAAREARLLLRAGKGG